MLGKKLIAKKEQPKLILASASPRRLELLRQIAIEPDYIYAANIDETPKYKEHPRFYVKRIAANKAIASYEHIKKLEEYNNFIILAADTIVAVGRTIVGKPKNIEEAKDCLILLSGRTHKVFTCIAAINNKGKLKIKLSENKVRFDLLNKKQINSYVNSYEWMGKAGGYAIQGKASAFITRIIGTQSSIMGLPLAELYKILISNNYEIHEQWIEESNLRS